MSRRARRVVAEFYPFSTQRQLIAAKREAGTIVWRAVASGQLRRLACAKCGAKRSEAHHDDYNKPLDVLWLCRHHHRQRDAELRHARRLATKQEAATALPISYLKRQARLMRTPHAVVTTKAQATKVRRSVVNVDCSVALVRQATLLIADEVNAAGLSERLLARRLKVSRQLVNMQFAAGFRTLKVLAAYADVLGYEASVVLRPKQSEAAAS